MADWEQIQRALQYAKQNPSRNVPLAKLAAEAGQSQFHAHRTLRAALGETPKQFTLRLRVDRAAAALFTSEASILDIAVACGFESHEAFCRAFQRRYKTSPSAYRRRARQASESGAHSHWVNEIGPCAGLYHFNLAGRNAIRMTYTISKKEFSLQPILVVRRRVQRAEIAATIGAQIPKVFMHAQQRALAIADFPVTRYLETSVGLVTLETGMRVSAEGRQWTAAEGEGDVLAETLPAGPAAVTIHFGPYDQLPAAYAALEEWIAANGLQSAGAPWEAYLNDPADHPDPKDWQTEVCWPVKSLGS